MLRTCALRVSELPRTKRTATSRTCRSMNSREPMHTTSDVVQELQPSRIQERYNIRIYVSLPARQRAAPSATARPWSLRLSGVGGEHRARHPARATASSVLHCRCQLEGLQSTEAALTHGLDFARELDRVHGAGAVQDRLEGCRQFSASGMKLTFEWSADA